MKKIRIKERIERLIERKFVEVKQNKEICPFLKIDNEGYYCAKNLKHGEEIIYERRIVCDRCSMEIFCINKERYVKCSFYQGNLSI